MTNGDRIRQMSNEELAEIIQGNCSYCEFAMKLEECHAGDCKKGIKAYLESEVE